MLSRIQSARDVDLSSSRALPDACAQAATGRCLQQQVFILTALEAEPQNPGISRGGSLWGLSPRLVDGHLLPVSSRGRPSCEPVSSSLPTKTQSFWMRAPPNGLRLPQSSPERPHLQMGLPSEVPGAGTPRKCM